MKVGVWVIYKDLGKQYVQLSVHMYLASRADILMTVTQLRDDLMQGFSPGQFFTDKDVSECQD